MNEKYYTLQDFASLEKIDAHVHIHMNKTSFVEQAVKDNFKIITINTDVPFFPALPLQEKYAKDHNNDFPGKVDFITAFSMEKWQDTDWSEKTIQYINDAMSRGAKGVKLWKNIGMTIKKADGSFLMIDDPVFDTVFNFLEENNIPVLGHLGEPKNCWLPLENMTMNSDRDYFSKYPEFHMYNNNDYPSYDDQINARDNMLAKHPDMKFIGAHLASLEWSVDEIAKRLDKFPNMWVDLTERICHLEYQCITDNKKVRDFMIKYQDRIIYGTDIISDESWDAEELKTHTHNIYTADWQFFTTDDEMEVPRLNGKFKGIKLPASVIDKIYYSNAVKCYY